MARRKKVKTTKEELTELYERAYSSLVDFAKIFLLKDEEIVPPADYHYLFSDLLLKEKKNFAIEGFRESAKTFYVVYTYPLYCLTFPHPSRNYIVFLKASDELAKNKLKDIRDIYLTDPLLSMNVEKIYQQGEVLDIQTKEGVRVRLEAYGKGANIRGLTWMGKRPSIVILDDVQSIDDVNSASVCERDWEWFLSDVYFLSKFTRIFMIGNNLGDRCILERLSTVADHFGFTFLKIRALKNGKSTWEGRFSTEELLAEKEAYRKAGKLDVWMRERMCECVSEERQVFKKSYLRYVDTLKKDHYIFYTGVDLAVSQKRTADYTAVCTIAVNSKNERIIVALDYGRWALDKTIEVIFSHVRRFHPLTVAIEKVAFQSVMEQILYKEMLKRNLFFRIDMVTPKGKKEDRIKSLQPLFKAGAFIFLTNASYLTELEKELLYFTEEGTRADHDDLLDALWLANYYVRDKINLNSKKKIQKKAKMI